MAEPAEVDVIVEADGPVQVSARRLTAHGLRLGDRLRLVPEPRHRRQSMLGAGARSVEERVDVVDLHGRPVGFGSLLDKEVGRALPLARVLPIVESDRT